MSILRPSNHTIAILILGLYSLIYEQGTGADLGGLGGLRGGDGDGVGGLRN